MTGTGTIDFGATPADEAIVTINTSGLGANDHIEAWTMRDTHADNNVDEHEMMAVFGRWSCLYVSATQFTAKCNLIGFLATGNFKFRWASAA